MPENNQTEMAAQQLIGYAHAKSGYSVTQLAVAMGLSAKEWDVLRRKINLPENDSIELDQHFDRKNSK